MIAIAFTAEMRENINMEPAEGLVDSEPLEDVIEVEPVENLVAAGSTSVRVEKMIGVAELDVTLDSNSLIESIDRYR